MKRQNITNLLIVLFCMASTISYAHDIEVVNSDGVMLFYNWIKNGSELEVAESINSQKYSGDVVIPDSVEYDGNYYPVTAIGGSAFYCCRSLTSVEIPGSVNSIGLYAFAECSRLNKVIVKDLAAWCENAGNFRSNPLFFAHHLYKDKTTEIVDLIIPEGVQRVGSSAFERCYSIQYLVVSTPNTVIDKYAFAGCSNLSYIYHDNNITSVGAGAFSGTAWYNKQPDGLVYIGKNAYQYKGEMPQNTSIIIEDGTLNITERAFYNCYNLYSITIPSSVKTLGEYNQEIKGVTNVEVIPVSA